MNKKIFLFASILTVVVAANFFVPGTVSARTAIGLYGKIGEMNITCPADTDSYRYAIFSLYDGHQSTSEYVGEYPNQRQVCVKVENGKTQLTFSELILRQTSAVITTDMGNVHLYKLGFSTITDDGDCNFNYRPIGVENEARNGIFDVSPSNHIVCPGIEFPNVGYRFSELAGVSSQTQFTGLIPLGFPADKKNFHFANCSILTPSECEGSDNCFWQDYNNFNEQVNQCKSKVDRSLCPTLPERLCGKPIGSPVCAWNTTQTGNVAARCITALEQGIVDENGRPPGYQGALPACAFEGTCRDINDVLSVAVTYAKSAFGMLGVFAFAFFVLGGFTIITSFGNAERVKKGQDILVAAVVGIIICFSAYAAIDFLLDALRVSNDYRIIGL